MPAKGTYDANTAISSKYRLEIPGLPPIAVTRVSELERSVLTVDLPDRTRQTAGEVDAGEGQFDTLLGQRAEHLALSTLLSGARNGVNTKVNALLFYLRADGTPSRVRRIQGFILRSESVSELNASGDPDPVTCTWGFSYDDLTWLPV